MRSTNNCDSKVFETKIKDQWQFIAIPHISACPSFFMGKT